MEPDKKYAAEEKRKRWEKFIEFCEALGWGRLEKLEIQDGVPLKAEVVLQQSKFI